MELPTSEEGFRSLLDVQESETPEGLLSKIENDQ
jgi:hypothetical protein